MIQIDGFDIERAYYHGVVALLRTTDDVVTFEVVRDAQLQNRLPGLVFQSGADSSAPRLAPYEASDRATPSPSPVPVPRVAQSAGDAEIIRVELIKRDSALGFSVAGVQNDEVGWRARNHAHIRIDWSVWSLH